MGRFGDSRFGGHMFGGGTEMGRVGRTRTNPFSTASERVASYHRDSVMFSAPIRVNTERVLQMAREPTVYTAPIAVDALRQLISRREGEMFAEASAADNERALNTDRSSTNSTSPIAVDQDRALHTERTGTSHTNPMHLDANRALSLERESVSFALKAATEADAMIPNWRIDGDQVKEFIDETRNWQQLELTFRAPENVAANSLRPLDQSTGKYETVEMPDGSYKIIERAANNGEVTIEPPENRDDLRTVNEFVVDDYDEKMSDQDSTIYIVELSLVGTAPKESTGGHGTDSAGDTEYHFAFADGEVATRRVEREIGRGGTTVEGARQLSIVLTERETIVLEESLNHQGGVRIREVPDAPNIVEDTTAEDRNTVTITPPSDEPDPEITADDYAVLEWESNLINDQRFKVNLTVVPLSG